MPILDLFGYAFEKLIFTISSQEEATGPYAIALLELLENVKFIILVSI
jgi:hypothetical protein